MGISLYMAMTAAEISKAPQFPAKTAFMACHFSPYGTGLSNIPSSLPEGSILILNDRTPISGHDPELIAYTLSEAVEVLACKGVLLDFQRPNSPETSRLCQHLLSELPCPIAISDLYAEEMDCPVFLSACPLTSTLQQHIEPWKNREIWLEVAIEAATYRITQNGCEYSQDIYSPQYEPFFEDRDLHCCYHLETKDDAVCFHLWRTMENIHATLEKAENLEVNRAIGLYQQFSNIEKLPVK